MHPFSYLLILSVVLGVCRFQANGEGAFTPPNYHLGYTNYEGKINVWVSLGMVQLSNGTALPLNLKFSSEPVRGKRSVGEFWECPLVESLVIPNSERSFRFVTPGGRTVFLRIDQNRKQEMMSGDRRYRGLQQSDSKISVTGEGWTYTFNNGRLRTAQNDDGVVLEWNFNNDRFHSIVERGRGEVLSFEYRADSAIPVAIRLGNRRYELLHQSVPVVRDVMKQLVISGYAPTIEGISAGGKSWHFPIKLNDSMEYSMDYQNDTGRRQTFVWRASDGQLLSDGEWTYRVAVQENKEPLVSRVNPAGQEESYIFDGSTGTSVHKTPDGIVTRKEYFGGYGPTYDKLRRLTQTFQGREIFSARWSYNEVGQLIRRESGGEEWNWEWHPNGAIAKLTKSRGGEVYLADTFNEAGLIAERVKGDTVYLYSSVEGDQVVRQVVNGITKAVVVKGGDQSGVAMFNVDNGKQGIEITAGADLGNRSVERAKALVMKSLVDLEAKK